MKLYKSVNYANDRLANTIARVKNTPAMIQKITMNKVQWISLDDVNFKANLLVNDIADLNINPVPLGYCNTLNGEAVYLMREPVRKDWKQGLRTNTLMVLRNGEAIEPRLIDYGDLARTIIGDYYKFGDVFNQIKNGLEKFSIAWDRSFMVKRNLEVVYREQCVIGKIDINADPENGVIDIAPNMEWVLEELEASIKW